MKRFLFFLSAIFLLSSQSHVLAQSKSTFDPKQPHIGTLLTILYDPGRDGGVLHYIEPKMPPPQDMQDQGNQMQPDIAPPPPGDREQLGGRTMPGRNPGAGMPGDRALMMPISVEVLLFHVEAEPTLLEASLMKVGTQFKAEIMLNDSDAVYGMYRFVLDKRSDDNQGKYWDFMMFDAKGNPREGAYLAKARSYISAPSGFRRTKNYDEALILLGKEKSSAALAQKIEFETWSVSLAKQRSGNEKLLTKIEARLDEIAAQNPADEETIGTLITWYSRIKNTAKANQWKEKVKALFPNGKLAQRFDYMALMEINSSEERATKAWDFYNAHPALEDYQRSRIANLLIQAQQYDKANKVIQAFPKQNPSMLNTLAWELIDGEKNVRLGILLATQAIDIFKNPDQSTKPTSQSMREWFDGMRDSYAATLDTYGYGLMKLNRLEEARQAFQEAFNMQEGKDKAVNERYAQCLMRLEQPEEVMQLLNFAMVGGGVSDTLIETARDAWMKSRESDEGFDMMIAEMKRRASMEAREKLKREKLNYPATTFTAIDRDDQKIDLMKLKGKVVVLDFWATWCGPCKSAFPFVQKVYDKYKDNPNIKILAVNTWESEKGQKRKETVTKFLTDHSYTFPVLYDESDIVDSYRVEGIPTQFYIDRKGNVQFMEVGFNGPELENKMVTMIDLLLSEEFYKAN